MGSYLDAKKWKPKTKQFNYARRPTAFLKLPGLAGLDKSTSKIPLTKLGTSELRDSDLSKTPIKPKKILPRRPGQSSDADVKQRKASVLGGQKEKEEQIKRYHAMVSGQNGGSAPRTSSL